MEGVASVSVGGTQANKASEEVFANLMQSEEAQSNDQCREYKGLGWPRGSSIHPPSIKMTRKIREK